MAETMPCQNGGDAVHRGFCNGTWSSGACGSVSGANPLDGFDALDRPVKKTYSDNATPGVSYGYTGTRLQSVTATGVGGAIISATTFTAFDPVGRITASTQTTNGSNYSFAYTWNLAGLPEQQTYPSLDVTLSCYDSAGRAASVKALAGRNAGITYAAVAGGADPDVPANTLSGYSPSGAIQRLILGNNVVEASLQNNRLQTSRVTASLLSGGSYTQLFEETMDYGTAAQNNGNIQKITLSNSRLGSTVQSWCYDKLNRLTFGQESSGGGLAVCGPNPTAGGTTQWKQLMQYDAYGNRAVDPSSTIPSAYATPQSLSGYGTENRWLGSGVGYDAAGNQTALPSRTFLYDAENRLISTTQPNMPPEGYVYDGNGRRVMKLACPVGSAAPCRPATTGMAVTAVFVYDAVGQLAAEFAVSGTAGLAYPVADRLGSTRLVTDGSGVVVKCYDYFAFGEDIGSGMGNRPAACYGNGSYPQAGPDVVNQKFTGKERDAETGLDYFGARYFSGAQGRFTGADEPLIDQSPGDPQSWNLYGYVRNNPLKFTDPTGQDCVYTNNLSSDGTVGVESGNCSQKSGTYVNGTINTDSFKYNERKGTLSYSYSNGETIGSGVIAGLPAPVQFPGIEGAANIAGAQRIVNQAGPVVDGLGEGLKLFGYLVAAPAMAAADCIAAGKTCSAVGTAMAMIPGGGEGETAAQIVARSRAGSVLREFPGQYMNSTLGEIQKDAKAGIRAAQKALKLLRDTRDKFQK